jgi:hypothetical protein
MELEVLERQLWRRCELFNLKKVEADLTYRILHSAVSRGILEHRISGRNNSGISTLELSCREILSTCKARRLRDKLPKRRGVTQPTHCSATSKKNQKTLGCWMESSIVSFSLTLHGESAVRHDVMCSRVQKAPLRISPALQKLVHRPKS